MIFASLWAQELGTDPIHELQRQRNADSRLNRDLFAEHRNRVTRLVLEALRGRGGIGRLCVLGAGHCNDLDLKALLRLGAEAHPVST